MKPRAFLPGRDGETSVFRVGGLGYQDIWTLGRDLVASPRGLTLYGRAGLTTPTVVKNGLRLDSAEPPERHAAIRGWPAGKDEILSVAQRLAAASSLVLHPDHV